MFDSPLGMLVMLVLGVLALCLLPAIIMALVEALPIIIGVLVALYLYHALT